MSHLAMAGVSIENVSQTYKAFIFLYFQQIRNNLASRIAASLLPGCPKSPPTFKAPWNNLPFKLAVLCTNFTLMFVLSWNDLKNGGHRGSFTACITAFQRSALCLLACSAATVQLCCSCPRCCSTVTEVIAVPVQGPRLLSPFDPLLLEAQYKPHFQHHHTHISGLKWSQLAQSSGIHCL